MKMLLRISMVLFAIVHLSGCVLLTDPATRLAYDIQDAALELEASDLNEIAFRHKPYGVEDHYRVMIQTTNPAVECNGSLGVGRSGTSYHGRFVTVPETLEVRKRKGESLLIRLVKTDKEWKCKWEGETLKGNKAIELIGLE